MRTINKRRAEVLAPIMCAPQNEQEEEEKLMFQSVDCQFTVNSLAIRLLNGMFSYKDVTRCGKCTAEDTRELEIISAHPSLKPDFSNLADAVILNFPDLVCHLCENERTVEREFGQCLYIEVNDSSKNNWLIRTKHLINPNSINLDFHGV